MASEAEITGLVILAVVAFKSLIEVTAEYEKGRLHWRVRIGGQTSNEKMIDLLRERVESLAKDRSDSSGIANDEAKQIE